MKLFGLKLERAPDLFRRCRFFDTQNVVKTLLGALALPLLDLGYFAHQLSVIEKARKSYNE